MNAYPRNWLWSLVPLLLGVALFFIVTGGKILQPYYIDWLMAGDPAQHWLGWQFFRSSPLLQWPLGANPEFGLELGSSVVFSDSIPLMAFIFKLLNPLLPEHFQYTGIWLLMCFCLQALFAWKLLELFTPNKVLLVLGCLFFAMAPSFVWRMHAHFALSAHWLLIAGLYLYFSKPFSMGRWAALLSVGVLIHAYLVAMLMAIALTDLVQRRWLKQLSTLKALGCVVGAFALVGMIMWAVGYFMVGSGVSGGGFGVFRMNLLSLFDPNDIWSKVLPDLNGIAGDYEGFNYMGGGMLVLAAVAVGTVIKNRPLVRVRATLIPLVALSVLLFIYALSSQVAFSNIELVSYPLPRPFKIITSTFRASGRFFWPAYYAIYLGVFFLLFTQLKTRMAVLVCATALTFQVFDTQNAWTLFKNKFSVAQPWESPMASPLWQDFARRYTSLIVVLPGNASAQWLPIAQFAATHGMSTNTGYFARIDPVIEKNMQTALNEAVTSQTYRQDALYIFEDDALWALASSNTLASDVSGVLDGFRILAPGLKTCAGCVMSDIESVADSRQPPYSSGVLSFGSGGNGTAFMRLGWSAPEQTGTWSQEETATLEIALPVPQNRKLLLQVGGHAFVSDEYPTQEIKVTINGRSAGTLKYDIASLNGIRTIQLPTDIDYSNHLSIRMDVKRPVSPAELGLSADSRRLGLSLETLEVTSRR